MLTPPVLLAFLSVFLVAGFAAWRLIRSRNMQYWLGSYLAWKFSRIFRRSSARKHVYFCFVDHYEPYGGSTDKARAHERVRLWMEKYPSLAAKHVDNFGNHPKHTFFYPIEEYDPELIDRLKRLCDAGFGDIEVHLHHDNDTAENFRATVNRYVHTLYGRHGLLRKDESGKIVYSFIHGNWALDNSRPDGRWCGVDNEIGILVETGCYADMTMPSAPSDTQTNKINSIYFASGQPGRRKSHNTGRDLCVGHWSERGELLLIQGPLTLNWKTAKFGIIPKIESAELSFDAPPTAHRVRLWGDCGIGVKGAEEHVFIKVHTHGATEPSMQMLFNGGFDLLWTELENQYRRDPACTLRYVTAWEMYSKIKELAGGRQERPARSVEKKTLRVLHIIESLDFGGAEKIVAGLANGMADSHEIAICCLRRIGVLGTEIDKRIRIFCLYKGEGNDYLLPLRLARLLKANRFDVVHTHNWAVFLEGGLAGLLAGTPVMLHTVHGPYTDYSPSLSSRLKIVLRHFLELLIARRFHRIVTVSDAIRNYIEKSIHIPGERLSTVHNGIPAAAKPPNRPQREIVTFITVGRLAPVKNHEMMLRAFHDLAKQHQNVRLVIVGDGPQRPALEAEIKRHRIEDKVSMRGFRPDIDALLADADIFMLTSRYEGISIALLEAMRSGLPAICTSVGGIPETVIDGETGLLVPLDNHEALVRAMATLAGSKTLRDEMGKQGYDYFVKEFSLETMLSRYQQLYTMNELNLK